MSSPIIDLTGQRIGRLIVLRYSNAEDNRKAWVCKCDCGAQVEIRGAHLRVGKTKSCGCLKREMAAIGMGVRHGMHLTRTYKSWDSMVRRCTTPTDPTYWRYGAAGIQVCNRWLRFEDFFKDMGERPAGHTLDRIDVQGNYEPGNCRWATAKTQANNRSNNRRVEYNGNKLTIRELCDLTGTHYRRTRDRVLRAGWTVEKALATPTQQKGKKA